MGLSCVTSWSSNQRHCIASILAALILYVHEYSTAPRDVTYASLLLAGGDRSSGLGCNSIAAPSRLAAKDGSKDDEKHCRHIRLGLAAFLEEPAVLTEEAWKTC